MSVKTILASIKKEASKRCNQGMSNRQNLLRLVRFVNGISLHYSKVLGFSQEEILESMEKNRDYYIWNYYQRHDFPRIQGNIEVFERISDFVKRFPSGRYRCMSCKSITTDPYTCNSGVKVNDKVCNWKVYGLFRLNGLYRFIIKTEFLRRMKVETIFPPIELENKNESDS